MKKMTVKYRRVLKICNLFVYNYAFFKAGWSNNNNFNSTNVFWISLNNNFYDISILEWCKLFGNNSENLHWKKMVQDKEEFKKNMFAKVGINQNDLNTLHNSVKKLRDKFIAHIDNENALYRPELNIALQLIIFLYGEIYKTCDNTSGFEADLESIYEINLKTAIDYYPTN